MGLWRKFRVEHHSEHFFQGWNKCLNHQMTPGRVPLLITGAQRVTGQMRRTNSHPARFYNFRDFNFNLDLQAQLTSAEFKEKIEFFVHIISFRLGVLL